MQGGFSMTFKGQWKTPQLLLVSIMVEQPDALLRIQRESSMILFARKIEGCYSQSTLRCFCQ